MFNIFFNIFEKLKTKVFFEGIKPSKQIFNTDLIGKDKIVSFNNNRVCRLIMLIWTCEFKKYWLLRPPLLLLLFYYNDKKLTNKKYYKCKNYTKILHNRLFYSKKKLHLLF